MLPSSEGQSSEPRRGKRTGGMVYLTNEMLSTKTTTAARILAVKLDDENRYGARVVLKMVLDGNTVYWGVNIKKNPNYKLLEKEFGREENDWVGKDIFLQLEKDDFSESYFARVTFAEKKGRTR